MIASSSAITTRTGLVTESRPFSRSGREFRGHAVEEIVLLAFQLQGRATQVVALTTLGVRVAPHLVRFGVRERSLGHEGPQPSVLRLRVQERALLVGDGQLGPKALQPVADVDQPALEQAAAHGRRQSTTPERQRIGVTNPLQAWPERPGGGAAKSRPMAVIWHRVMVHSSPHAIFTPEHDALRQSVRRFVDTEVRPYVDEWERELCFPDALFTRCGELGFLGLHYPEGWGGSGGDLAAGIVFVEELARCGAGAIPMAISVQTDMATPALEHFGADDQCERWLRPAIAGTKIGAIAITEPDAGSDVARIHTRAVRDGDVWRITGRKLFITNGARAHFLTLVTKTDAEALHAGISLFIVDTSLPGVTV